MNTKKSKRIGFDLDDVLLNFNEALLDHANKKYDKNVEKKDIKTFLFLEENFGIPTVDAISMLDNFFFHDDHLNVLPVEGAQEVVKKLSEYNELFIITAKPDALEEVTKKWLEKYFTGLFENVHFANHFLSVDKRRKKSEICLELQLDYFIDDSIDYATDVASVGIPVLLLDTPWNQTDKLPENITRVYSWTDIEKKLL
ncbi:hypothetical protein H0W91_02845 [Patescibacteria group bacterium]|nr:hypothetical protein [Patescibacteria group bacterium]